MTTALHTAIKKLLPSWIYDRLIGDWDKEGFKKYFSNTSWVFFAKLTSFVVSFFTIAIVARYLGPENLGRISYAQSFIAIFSALAALGIDQILYRNLVAQPEKEDVLLGTAILSKFIFGAITVFSTVIIAYIVNDDIVLTWLIGIVSLTFIFQPLGTVSQVFNARVQSKYPSYISLVIAFMIPALKLVVIYFNQGVIYFAGVIAFEALFYGLANIYLYQTVLKRSLRTWSVSFSVFTELIRDSWPLILAGVSGYLYARIDQVMILHYMDSSAVGFYDIAVKLTEFLGFLPGVIIGSLFPAVINAKKTDPAVYQKRLRALSALCIGIALISAILLFILAPYIIKMLFGSAFTDSIALVRIYTWSTLGTIATALMYNYFVAENKTRLFLIFTVGGAVINVILNLFFIPNFGAAGASYATLLTFTVSVTVFLTIRKRLLDLY